MATSTRAMLKAAVVELLDQADAVIATASTGEYLSASEYEADANAVRADLSALMADLDAEWGLEANPTIRALRSLGARLLDLREGVAEETATLAIEVTKTTDLISLAVERYADFERWTDLAAVNRKIRHLGFIAAGSEVTVYAR